MVTNVTKLSTRRLRGGAYASKFDGLVKEMQEKLGLTDIEVIGFLEFYKNTLIIGIYDEAAEEIEE